jgi:hypothetical protein
MAKRPSADLRILPLGEMHDRAGFTCGVETLDRYLKTQAGQDVRRKANAVLLLGLETESERVLGYYTLCAMAVSQGEVPEAARKHVPRYPLVSCTLMVRPAVARDQQVSVSAQSCLQMRWSAHSRAPAPWARRW